MRIGLLEDNPAILDYMTTALEMAGHSVQTYVDGDSLLETLLTSLSEAQRSVFQSPMLYPLPYDVVIVDLLLPTDISGLEVIRHIHRTIPPEKLPIVVVSACSQEELDAVKEQFPQVTVLRKPFKMNALLSIIEFCRGGS